MWSNGNSFGANNCNGIGDGGRWPVSPWKGGVGPAAMMAGPGRG